MGYQVMALDRYAKNRFNSQKIMGNFEHDRRQTRGRVDHDRIVECRGLYLLKIPVTPKKDRSDIMRTL